MTRIIIAFAAAAIGIAVVTLPVMLYLERLELQGKINPPDWLVQPIAFGLIGAVLFLTKVILVLMERYRPTRSEEK